MIKKSMVVMIVVLMVVGGALVASAKSQKGDAAKEAAAKNDSSPEVKGEYKKSRVIKLEYVDNLSDSSMSDEEKAYKTGRTGKEQKSFFGVTDEGNIYIIFPHFSEGRKYDVNGKYLKTIRWSRPGNAGMLDALIVDSDDVYIVNGASGENKRPILFDRNDNVMQIELDKRIKRSRHIIRNGVAYHKGTGDKIAVVNANRAKQGKKSKRKHVWEIKFKKEKSKDKSARFTLVKNSVELELNIEGYRVHDGVVVAVDAESYFYVLYRAGDDTLTYGDGRGGIRTGARFWISKYSEKGKLLETIDLEVSYLDPDIAVLPNGDIYQYHAIPGEGYSVTKWSRQ